MSTVPTPYRSTPHLADLLHRIDRLAATLAAADDGSRRRLAAERAEAAALATLRLDGASMEVLPPADAVPASLAAPVAPDAPTPTPWFDAFRTFDEPPDDAVQALEAAGARAGLAADDLDAGLVDDPLATLAELHRRLTRGLVAPERAGAPRRSEQAVHDASVGRVLYFTAEPDQLPELLDQLAGWLRADAGDEHPVVRAGRLHLELLRLHPFDAANGRLARAAARSVLRAGGVDPDGLAAPELALVRDPLGYHEEVARTLRRRDAGIWLERWAEAVADGLRAAARALALLDPDVPARATDFLATAPAAFTVGDYRDRVGVGAEAAREELRTLLDAGAVALVPGSRGLRYERVG